MKKLFAGCLILVLFLLTVPAALAEEGTVALKTQPIMGEPVFEQYNGPVLFSDAQWDSTHTSYYDQLTVEEKAIYDKVLTAHNAFAEDMENFDLTDASGLMHRTTITYPVTDEQGNPLADENGDPLVVEYEYWRINDVVEETRPYKEETFASWYDENGERVMRACQALAFDHPEFFWIRQGVAWFSGDDEKVFIVNGNVTTHVDAGFIAYPMSDTAEECIALQAELDEVVTAIMAELEKPEYSDVEKKLAYVDNWLAEHNRYNEIAAADSGWLHRDETPWSIVSGLLDEYAPVCEGYAKAFQLICHKLGVPCLQVSGSAYQVKDDGTLANGGDHMWNAVKLDQFWFVCDATWDDPLYGPGVDKDSSSRRYFLVNQPVGHFADMQFVTPNCGTFTVSFDANGHGTAPQAQIIPYCEAAVEPETLTEEGYTFGGWYTDAECTEQWSFGTEITQNVTLYAKWTINTYTVSFDANGHGTAPDAQTIAWNEKAIEPEAPTEKNCGFEGWYIDAECTTPWDFTGAVTADVMLYAKWIEYGFDNVAVDRIVAELANAQEGDAVDTDTWECGEDGITGLEVGTGTMMMALYKEKKMLGVIECQVIYQNWDDSGWNVYTVSEVDLELFAQADEIIRFNSNSFYVPISGTRTVK